MRIFPLALVFAAALASPAAFAQAAAPPARLTGTVTQLREGDLIIQQADGASAAVHLADGYRVATLSKATAADIKAGSFIGAGARPQPDGTLAAVQIVIFPEAMRGAGEGHRAWGVLPESTMTNATVAESVASVAGPLLVLKYKDGEKKLTIPAEANVLLLGVADKSALTPGANVQVAVTKQADGAWQAARVTVLGAGASPM